MINSPTHRTLQTAPGRGPVHVLDFGGSGEAIVLIHGLDGSAANWWDVGARLAVSHRVVALDLPGFGRTTTRGHRLTMTAHADLVAQVCDLLGLHSALVVGNSMGAVVALLVARRHPDLVRGLSLVAPALPGHGRGPLDAKLMVVALALGLGPLARLEPKRRALGQPAARVRALLDRCYAPGNRESPDAFEAMIDVARDRATADAVRGWSRAARSLWWWLARRGRFHRLADGVTVPVQLIEGGADPVIPHSSVVATMGRHPSWRHLELQGVGHVPQLEAPAAFCRELLDHARDVFGRVRLQRAD